MGFTVENAQKWLSNIREGGALPKVDYALLNASIANAGNVTRGIDLATQTPEQLEQLAMKSVDTAPFADKAQAKEMLKAYIKDDLIPNSYKMDQEKGQEKGTGLRNFFERSRTATQGVDFDSFKKDPMGFMMKQDKKEVEKITTEIRGAAHDNIKEEILSKDGKEGSRTIEQDFVHSIKNKTDEQGQSIYKDVKADEPKAMGGGMMEILLAFIGMLLGVNLAGMLGGQQQSNASYDERANDNSPATPQQQQTADTLKKGIQFAEILKDNAINKDEFGQVMGEKQTAPQKVVAASLNNHVILTPNSDGENPGNTVIYAKKDATGRLSDVQVSTTGADGNSTVKAVQGDFVLTDKNSKEIGNEILATAETHGVELGNKNAPGVLVDDIASGLATAVQKMREQGANR